MQSRLSNVVFIISDRDGFFAVVKVFYLDRQLILQNRGNPDHSAVVMVCANHVGNHCPVVQPSVDNRVIVVFLRFGGLVSIQLHLSVKLAGTHIDRGVKYAGLHLVQGNTAAFYDAPCVLHANRLIV